MHPIPDPTPGLTGPAAARDVAIRVEIIRASERAIEELHEDRDPFAVRRDWLARIRAVGVLFGIPRDRPPTPEPPSCP